MTQFVGPDNSDRFARTEPGRWMTIYTDQACTTPAAINAYDPNNPDNPGALISGSRVTVGADRLIPLFWYPNNVRVLWGQPSRGETVVVRLAASYDAQFASGGGGGGGIASTGGTFTGPVLMQGSAAGGLDASDTTSRITVQSFQTNGNNNFGEGLRFDLNRFYSKNMIAWRLPLPVSGDLIENFVANLSFEADTSSWSTVGAASVALSAARVLIGNESGKITYGTGAGGTQGISSVVTGLIVGHTYTLVAWVYNPTGSPGTQVDIDATGPTTTSALTNTWEELDLTFVASSTSHTVRITNTGTAAGQFVYADAIQVTPAVTAPKSVVWIGAHYEAQDLSGVHGHWSLEVPDSVGALKTRFEVRFADRTTGVIGLDKTLVQTSAADLVVDCSAGQVLRLRTGMGAVKAVEWSNAEDGSTRRWQARQNGTTETGSQVGSDWELARFGDSGTVIDNPITVTRSSGRVTFGGSGGSASGVTINRSSSGQALTINNTGTGGTGYAHVANTADAATGRTMQSSVLGETGTRFVQYADGKHEFGDGTNPRDVVLYRSAAGVLKTDTAMHVAGDFRHLGTNLGFYNTAQVAKQTVTGAKSTTAALASLMTALAALGLVTDNTSA